MPEEANKKNVGNAEGDMSGIPLVRSDLGEGYTLKVIEVPKVIRTKDGMFTIIDRRIIKVKK